MNRFPNQVERTLAENFGAENVQLEGKANPFHARIQTEALNGTDPRKIRGISVQQMSRDEDVLDIKFAADRSRIRPGA